MALSVDYFAFFLRTEKIRPQNLCVSELRTSIPSRNTFRSVRKKAKIMQCEPILFKKHLCNCNHFRSIRSFLEHWPTGTAGSRKGIEFCQLTDDQPKESLIAKPLAYLRY